MKSSLGSTVYTDHYRLRRFYYYLPISRILLSQWLMQYAEQIKSGDISYVLPSDARAHDMSLSVWDRAGNKTVYTASNVVVASDLFSYLTANPVRLFRVICVGIVAFGVLGTLVCIGARHMKATADERDPFGSSAGK